MIGLKTLPQYKTVEAAQPSQYNMAWREQTMEANFIYEIKLWVMFRPVEKVLQVLTAHRWWNAQWSALDKLLE